MMFRDDFEAAERRERLLYRAYWVAIATSYVLGVVYATGLMVE